jgi:hypothetical protein
VRHIGGRVYIHHKPTGQIREFHPETGDIGLPLKLNSLPEQLR